MFQSDRLIIILWTLLILSGCASFQNMIYKNHVGLVKPNQQYANTDLETLYQRAKDYQEKKEYAEAIGIYEDIIKFKTDHYEAYNGLGVIYSILGEHQLAIELINEAVRLAPLASHLQNNLGYAYLSYGKLIEAAGAFERALQLDPNNSFAINNLNSVYQQMGCVQDQPCGQWQDPD